MSEKDSLLIVLILCDHSSEGGIVPPFLNHPPLFSKFCHPPDKHYLFFTNIAFHSSADAVENVTVKEILISV